jgi:hypothetical protein
MDSERERSGDGVTPEGDAKSRVDAVCSRSALQLIATAKWTSLEVRNVPQGDCPSLQLGRHRGRSGRIQQKHHQLIQVGRPAAEHFHGHVRAVANQ